VRQASATRAATILEVSLNLTGADAARLAARSAGAPPIVMALLAHPGTARWVTREELDTAVAWLRSVANGLNESAIVNSLREDAHEVTAVWRWPDHPLVEVFLDDSAIAVVDYLPASASAHWYLRWTGDPRPAHGLNDLPLLPLATRVPEEAEEDSAMRAAVLDAAIEAAANKLTGRTARLALRDV
jgi:hypothetical protein